MTATKCRAKDPSTCRIHGTKPLSLPGHLLYGKNAGVEILEEIDTLKTFIKTEAAKNILDYSQYEKLQQEISDYETKYNLTVSAYQRVVEAHVFAPTPEAKAKLDMVEEARAEFQAQYPEADKRIQKFDEIVTKNATTRFGIYRITKAEQVQQVYNFIKNLQPGQKFALEFYDGSRLIRTVEEQAKGWKEKMGFSKNPVNKNTIDISPLSSKDHLTVHDVTLSLGKTRTGVSLANVKSITILKNDTPEIFTEPGTPENPSQNTTGFYQINTPETEGIFYQSKGARALSNIKNWAHASATLYFELTGEGTITKVA